MNKALIIGAISAVSLFCNQLATQLIAILLKLNNLPKIFIALS
jgi:hypothetical protein